MIVLFTTKSQPMVFAGAGWRASRAVLTLYLASVLAACSTLVGPRSGEDDWAHRGEEAFRLSRYPEAEQRLERARMDEVSGHYASAQRAAAEVADYGRRQGDHALQARALNSVALAQRRLGRNAESLTTAQEALSIAQKIGTPTLQAESLKSIGAAYQAQGKFDQAYDAYTRGLALAEAAADRQIEAQLHNDLGGLYRFRAEYQQSKEAYERSLELRKQLGDVRGEGKVLGNLCNLYQNLGDLRRALALCKSSLVWARASGDLALEANNLNNLGGLHRTLGEYRPAIDAYQRSLRMKRELGDRAGEARALGNLGDLHRRQGDIPGAIGYFADSMRIAESIDDHAGQSAAQYLLGLAYLDARRYEDACTALWQALALQTTIGQPELLWRSFDGLSRCWQARSNPALAIFFGKQAVNTIQRVRINIDKLEPELQRNFVRDKADVYRRLIDLLIDQGRLPEAQQMLAMLKEEEYFDFVRRDGKAKGKDIHADFDAAEQPWKARYDEIAGKLVALGEELDPLKQISPSARSAAEQAQIDALEHDLTASRAAFAVLLQEMRPAFAKLNKVRTEELAKH